MTYSVLEVAQMIRQQQGGTLTGMAQRMRAFDTQYFDNYVTAWRAQTEQA
jgi:predicted outer membrane protein